MPNIINWYAHDRLLPLLGLHNRCYLYIRRACFFW